MIKVESLIFDYPGKRALRGVSFEVEAGSITALVGPNGAGKTTLLRAMAALHVPLSGRIEIAGVDAIEDPRECHRQVGYLSDFFGLYERLSVEQALLYMAGARGLRGEAVASAAREAIASVDLEQHASKPARTLSRGLRQRLALAMALVHKPRVLLLDEPASGLDPEARHSLSALFVKLRSEGITLLVSSHILAELEDYSTHMLVLRDGAIVDNQRVTASASAEQSYVVEVLSDLDAALAVLRAQPSIEHAARTGQALVFSSRADRAQIAACLAALVNAGVSVAAFYARKTTMQDAYLARVTGAREAP